MTLANGTAKAPCMLSTVRRWSRSAVYADPAPRLVVLWTWTVQRRGLVG